MKRMPYFTLLMCGSVIFHTLPVSVVHAQTIPGVYAPKPDVPEKKKQDTLPVPKVFSSQLRSTAQAERIDALYYDLQKSLWDSAQIGFQFHETLMEHLKPERFQITRYAGEFKGDLDSAMSSLNTLYKDMQKKLADADERVHLVRAGIAPDEQALYDRLWNSKKEELRNTTEAYFKSEHDFLQTYNALVKFILKQSGSYYYDSGVNAVHFTRMGGYRFFGSQIDKLNALNAEQKNMLLQFAPIVALTATQSP